MSIRQAYDDHDATGLAALVRAREVTAGELLDELLARIDERNPSVNAVVSVFEGRARAAIDQGLPDGPFAGVPLLLKDLGIDVAGEVTSSGSRFFRDWRAPESSELTRRYEQAGFVLAGKTNTPEMGLNVTTEPVLFGPTRNPWDLARSAGGSSGGAAAAVAAGLVPVAHATDGGGSIRIPASHCGLFGLKPNRGRTPVGPPLGEGWNGLSHGHVVSRSVRDSAALLDATAGSSVGEPYAAPAAGAGSFLDATKRPPRRLRAAVVTTMRPGVALHDEARAAVAAGARVMAELGHDVVEAELTVDWPALGKAFAVLTGANVAATIRERAAQLGRQPTLDDLEYLTWTQYGRAATVGAMDYVDAVRTMHRTAREVGAFFETLDVVMTPTVGVPPPLIGEIDMNSHDIGGFGARATQVSAFLGLFNFTGQPAMSVPLHWTAEGLPVGVQFVARLGGEQLLFALAAQLELAAPWAHRRAPLAG